MVYIYVIAAANHSVKIGIAGNPQFRLRELQTGCPFRLKVFAQFKITNRSSALKLERQIHKRLGRVQLEGEWFNITAPDAVATITSILSGAPTNQDAKAEIAAAREFRQKPSHRIIVCPYCQHAKQTALDNKTIWHGKFRCTACNALFPGRRFLIRRVA